MKKDEESVPYPATPVDLRIARRGNGDKRGDGEIRTPFQKLGDRPPLTIGELQTHAIVTDPREIDEVRARELGVTTEEARAMRRKKERKVNLDYRRRIGRASREERRLLEQAKKAMKDAPEDAQFRAARHGYSTTKREDG